MSYEKLIGAALCGVIAFAAPFAQARDTAQLGRDAQTALVSLYAKVPATKALGRKAKAILVFPSVTKGGLGVGGQYGEGALIRNGKAVDYYSTAGASYGLQIGMQTYGYALFFMTDKALGALDETAGFEVGVGPSIAVVDEGTAKNMTTTSMHDDVYAFVFGQKGLMAGLGVQGNKITKLSN